MIDLSFKVTKSVTNIPVRQYQDHATYSELDADTGYLLACKINDAVDALLRSLEDDEQAKKELLRAVTDHCRSQGVLR